MPTVLRQDGFRVVIFHPPREHKPPHVHVWNADGEVIIGLPARGRRQTIREVAGMGAADVTRAFWLVEAHANYLLERWNEYHG